MPFRTRLHRKGKKGEFAMHNAGTLEHVLGLLSCPIAKTRWLKDGMPSLVRLMGTWHPDPSKDLAVLANGEVFAASSPLLHILE